MEQIFCDRCDMFIEYEVDDIKTFRCMCSQGVGNYIECYQCNNLLDVEPPWNIDSDLHILYASDYDKDFIKYISS